MACPMTLGKVAVVCIMHVCAHAACPNRMMNVSVADYLDPTNGETFMPLTCVLTYELAPLLCSCYAFYRAAWRAVPER